MATACRGAVLLVVLLAVLRPSAPSRADTFSAEAAREVEAVVPVIGNDVNHAHQEALTSAFRRALLKEMAVEQMAPATRNRILDHPEQYVLGYSVREQTRKDAFYRLKLLLWVDADMLREEAAGAGASR